MRKKKNKKWFFRFRWFKPPQGVFDLGIALHFDKNSDMHYGEPQDGFIFSISLDVQLIKRILVFEIVHKELL